MQTSHVHARDPISPRMLANSFWRDSDLADSSDKGLFRSLRTIRLYVALAQGRRLCGTTWVTSKFDVTQNCRQPNGETLMFPESPHSSYSHDRNLNHNLVQLFLDEVH
jgi:hypothetical protein